MKVENRLSGDVAIVVLEGELDSHTAPAVQEELDQVMNSHQLVLLDLSGTSYMSSAGLRVLLLIFQESKLDGSRVLLAGPVPEVREVLTATGFADSFTIVDTVGDGLEVLSR